MVHEDTIGHRDVSLFVDQYHFAGIGCRRHRSGIALQLKIFEFDCKRKLNHFRPPYQMKFRTADGDIFAKAL